MSERTFSREVASVVLKAVVVIVSIFLVLGIFGGYYEYETISDGACNIAVFPLEGVILPFSSYGDYSLVITPKTVRDFIALAETDPLIEGLLFEINSPGGTPVAAEQISENIRSSILPSVSLIGDIGASGAYLVASAANTIIASPMSDVGSIGVTMSYVEESEKNKEEGLTFVSLSSGEFKDAGNPNKPLTESERKIFEHDLKIVHDEFVRQVALLRGVESSEIESLADGSSMPGLRALEVGLVDTLGGRQKAKEEFSVILNKEVSQISFCEYQDATLF